MRAEGGAMGVKREMKIKELNDVQSKTGNRIGSTGDHGTDKPAYMEISELTATAERTAKTEETCQFRFMQHATCD
jgi:hypothetical protein